MGSRIVSITCRRLILIPNRKRTTHAFAIFVAVLVTILLFQCDALLMSACSHVAFDVSEYFQSAIMNLYLCGNNNVHEVYDRIGECRHTVSLFDVDNTPESLFLYSGNNNVHELYNRIDKKLKKAVEELGVMSEKYKEMEKELEEAVD
nr:hypothetical protein [Tanacetum cinerariifolium]